MRFELNQLLTKMDGNDKLDQLLADILSNTDKAKALAAHLGLGESDSSAPVQNEGEK